MVFLKPEWTLLFLKITAFFLLCQSPTLQVQERVPELSTSGFHRIISLSPSVTEILFALGLGDRVIGVTRYCEFPPEAKARTIVGGYLDTNYEKMLELQPDLVVTIKEHTRAIGQLKQFHVEVVKVDHNHILGILDSVSLLGRTCGVQDEAASLLNRIATRQEVLKLKTAGLKRPKVLVTIGRNWGSNSVTQLSIAGRDGFLSELIKMAGGVNAYEGSIPFPQISREGLLTLDPDIIIELVPDMQERGLSPSDLLAEWHGIKELKAVRNSRIFILSEKYMMIPGPRFMDAAERLFSIIHGQELE